MANRILGMGDILTLIEKAQESIDEKKAAEMEQKLRKASFDFDDYLMSMEQMRNMGGLQSILSMMPGLGMKADELSSMVDEKQLARIEAIIHSMTPEERATPAIINGSRRKRIARGSGTDIQEINRLIKQFDETRKMMHMMTDQKKMAGLMRRMPRR